MNRRPLRTAVPILSTTALLLTGATAASAAAPAPTGEPVIVLDNGTVVHAGETVTFSFTGDKPAGSQDDADAGSGVHHPTRCIETNDKPTYTVKGTPYFLEDRNKPQSTYLLPRQTVSWAVTGTHTFTWDVGTGVEIDANAILAKAKVKLDTKISNSWTWTGTQTVTDTNTTSKAYRAVLGQVGWKITSVKSWVAAPCTPKTKTIVIKTPRRGDMSIGRQSS
ncbi:hypothetical protein [Actinoplanes sp. L3-i22]|uniref:hypothetical protein n=1 Tax=Actinoplanes sp. L3-i22 TaxID=2836373 RepID=UPI001C745815|nr:hypothetical protein [Actinoplanes sp. L3-i22]BCY14149.1 hypothetical protein L3i22_092370 [Actinoplanes sp. L3-i22]